MTVREIVKAQLEEKGYDGLCTRDCGCGLDDLMPCNDWCGNCEPARKITVTQAMRESEEGVDFDPDWDEIYVPLDSPLIDQTDH